MNMNDFFLNFALNLTKNLLKLRSSSLLTHGFIQHSPFDLTFDMRWLISGEVWLTGTAIPVVEFHHDLTIVTN